MIWGVRYVAPRLLLSVGFFWTAFKITAQSFFVSKILSNFMAVAFSSVWATPKFIASALNSAEPQVLVLISACGIAGFFGRRAVSALTVDAMRAAIARRARFNKSRNVV